MNMSDPEVISAVRRLMAIKHTNRETFRAQGRHKERIKQPKRSLKCPPNEGQKSATRINGGKKGAPGI